MIATDNTGRLAGLIYLIVVVTGMFSLAYVPSQITIPGRSDQTVANIVTMAPLFKAGVASFVVEQVGFAVLPLVFFRLFRLINRPVAILMVVLALLSIPLSLAALAQRLSALSWLTDPLLVRAFSAEQLHAMARASLESYRQGILLASVFWGLWLLPLGWLIIQSKYAPRVLGILLMIGGLGYLVDVFGQILLPAYSASSASDYVLLPAALGEIGTCLWLLIVGGRWRKAAHRKDPSKPAPPPATA